MIFSQKQRVFLILSFDIIAIMTCYLFAIWLRFDFSLIEVMKYKYGLTKVIPIAVIMHLLCYKIFNIDLSLWRYISIEEAIRVCLTVIIANLSVRILISFIEPNVIPISIYYIAMILIVCCMLGVRILYRYLRLVSKTSKETNSETINAIIIGAGDAGNILVKELLNNNAYNCKVLGYLDDSVYKKNRLINGLKVYGTIDELYYYRSRLKIEIAFIAIPSATPIEIKRIVEACKEINLNCKIMGITEVGNNVTNIVREISIEDLLGRGQISLDSSEIARYIGDKTIMVTGGGGSIGSELCRQMLQFKPKRLICFDIYENNLYNLQQELIIKNRASHGYDNTEIIYLVGSVRDKVRLNDVLSKYKPNVLFHAAAHKHVPLMEDSPLEAIKNNVFGTNNTLNCCIANGVEKFILISTDKAVNPTNIMGATKRMCELIIQSKKNNGVTKIGAVRFGNVLGSNGSVIPLFQQQIKSGGPVCVTDADITRYFMTIPEASQLVLQAGAYAENGDIYVLDMGEPVKILKLAQDLISLSGFIPYEEIDIEFTGLRPGEKMYEELSLGDEVRYKTNNELIYVNEPLDIDPLDIDSRIKVLQKIINDNNEDELRIQLFKIIN